MSLIPFIYHKNHIQWFFYGLYYSHLNGNVMLFIIALIALKKKKHWILQMKSTSIGRTPSICEMIVEKIQFYSAKTPYLLNWKYIILTSIYSSSKHKAE